jgi:hypothetical protein
VHALRSQDVSGLAFRRVPAGDWRAVGRSASGIGRMAGAAAVATETGLQLFVFDEPAT